MRFRRSRSGSNKAVSVGAGSVTPIVAANGNRVSLVIQNTGGASISYGFSTAITTGTALSLGSGVAYTLENHAGPVYATVGSGTVTVQVAELFG